MSNIIGIWMGIDAGACIVKNGKIACAISEERLSRVKHCTGFPELSLKYILNYSKTKPEEVNSVAINSRKSLRYLYHLLKYNNFRSFSKNIYKKFFKQKELAGNYHNPSIFSYRRPINFKEELTKLKINAKIYNINHHEAHLNYAYYTSGFKNTLALSIDGEGDGISGILAKFTNGEMKIYQKIGIHGQSFGLTYGCITEALGFSVNDGEGKTMGLAAYGKVNDTLLKDLSIIFPKIKNKKLISQIYWDYLTITDNEGKPKTFFRDSYYIRTLVHKYGKENVAAAAQFLLEKTLLSWLKQVLKGEKKQKLVLAGGVALNISNNSSLLASNLFEKVFIPPAPGDNGLPVALALSQSEKFNERIKEPLVKPYLGKDYTSDEVFTSYKKIKKDFGCIKLKNVERNISLLLCKGFVIGWFHGRSEWGNRALGGRSVIADPRREDMKNKINLHLKQRDWFMPFAPSVLADYGSKIFKNHCDSIFMNHRFFLRKEWIRKVPAIVHVDGSARPNFVHRETNLKYYNLISEFMKITNIPLILNTSFNKHGLPIVETPHDACQHLEWKCIELLSIEDYLIFPKKSYQIIKKTIN